MYRINGFIYTLLCICTGMIGHTIHGSFVWTIIDFFFAPLIWGKWLICQEVSVSIIKHSFEFFFK